MLQLLRASSLIKQSQEVALPATGSIVVLDTGRVYVARYKVGEIEI